MKYISKSIGAGLLEAFCHSMGMNIYDVTTNGGYCLCYVATECSADDAQTVFIQVAAVLGKVVNTFRLSLF